MPPSPGRRAQRPLAPCIYPGASLPCVREDSPSPPVMAPRVASASSQTEASGPMPAVSLVLTIGARDAPAFPTAVAPPPRPRAAHKKLRRRLKMKWRFSTNAPAPPEGNGRASPPTSAAQNGNGSGASSSRYTAVASSVQAAARKLDEGARVTFVGCDPVGRTTVKIATGAHASVAALQAALARLLPLARVSATEDVLSGDMMAQVVIPTAEDEWLLARERVSRQPALRAVRATASALAVCAATLYAAHLFTVEI